jgi:hypothetical protein
MRDKILHTYKTTGKILVLCILIFCRKNVSSCVCSTKLCVIRSSGTYIRYKLLGILRSTGKENRPTALMCAVKYLWKRTLRLKKVRNLSILA